MIAVDDLIKNLEDQQKAISAQACVYLGILECDLTSRGWTKHPLAQIYLPPKLKEYVP